MQVSTNAWGNCLGKCQQKLPDGSSRFPVNALNDCNCYPQHEHQHLVIYWSTRIIASLWLFCGQMLIGILHWLSLGHLVLITRKWEIWFLCRRCWHYLLSDEGVSVVCQGIRKFPRMLEHVVTPGYLRWWQNCVTRNMDCEIVYHWIIEQDNTRGRVSLTRQLLIT
mgnify:CR=1 FL=1